MKIEITNRQRIKRINLKSLRKKLTNVGAGLAPAHKINGRPQGSPLRGISTKKISFVLCDNKFITGLNQRYFRKSFPTDVIAFPLKDDFDPDYLGEVVVSVEEAVKVSNVGAGSKPALKWQDELILYCIHGILHLIGYDDRTGEQRQRMEKKQEQILRGICRGGARPRP